VKLSKMRELAHNVEVHIARAGESLMNDAAMNELHDHIEKGAA
jgi:hypothetical protein